MKEIEATVFSAAEEADVLHDRRRSDSDSITLSLSPPTTDHKCRPLPSIKKNYGRDLDIVTVRNSRTFLAKF